VRPADQKRQGSPALLQNAVLRVEAVIVFSPVTVAGRKDVWASSKVEISAADAVNARAPCKRARRIAITQFRPRIPPEKSLTRGFFRPT